VPEKSILQIERFGTPEKDAGFEPVSALEVLSTFQQAEMAGLAKICGSLYRIDSPSEEKDRKLAELDEISESFLPYKISEFPYYYPKNPLAVLEKEKYRKVGNINAPHGDSILQPLPDGSIVTAGGEMGLRVLTKNAKGDWSSDLIENQKLGVVVAIQSLPNGQIATSDDESYFRIWEKEPKSGEKWRERYREKFSFRIKSIQALPDGRMILGGLARHFEVLKKDNRGICVFESDVPSSYLTEYLQVLPDGRLLSCGDAFTSIFTEENGTWHEEIIGPSGAPFDHESIILNDGRIVAGGKDVLKIWSKDENGIWNNSLISPNSDSEPNIFVLHALPGNRFVTGGIDRVLRIWTEKSDGIWKTEKICDTDDFIIHIAVDLRGKIFAILNNRKIIICDGKKVRRKDA